MRKPFSIVCVAAVGSCFVFAATLRADDKAGDKKPTPEGTWKWTFERNDQKIEMAVKLKWADGKLTGVYVGREGRESPIKDGGFKDGDVSFVVVRERNGQEFAIKYQAKLEGDTLRGKTEFTGPDGQTRGRDWEAKRESAPANLTGPWKVKLETPMGTIERIMKLKQDGEKVTGSYTGQIGEMEIKEGKVKGAEFSFLVAAERDGQSMSFKYKGKQQGDSIKGTIDYDLAGNQGTIDFVGERVKDEPKEDQPKKDDAKKDGDKK